VKVLPGILVGKRVLLSAFRQLTGLQASVTGILVTYDRLVRLVLGWPSCDYAYSHATSL